MATVTTQTISMIIGTIILGIYLPFSIYGTFMYYKYRHHVIVKKRRPEITFVICAMFIIVIICEGMRAPAKSFNQQLIIEISLSLPLSMNRCYMFDCS